MIRKPWFTYDSTTSIGVDSIPQYSNVHIIDAGAGAPKFINVFDISNITPASTIADLLLLTAQWVEIGGGSGLEVINIDTNTTALNNQMLVADTNTPGTPAYTISLPAAPADGDMVVVMDGNGNGSNGQIAVDPVTVGTTIDGVIDILMCDSNYFDIKLVYDSAEDNWQLAGDGFSNSGNTPFLTKEQGGVAWVTGTAYAIGDVVSESGSVYTCTTGHPASAAFATDSANWAEVSDDKVSKSGDTMTGDLIFDNDTAIRAYELDGTTDRHMMRIANDDTCRFGSGQNDTLFYSKKLEFTGQLKFNSSLTEEVDVSLNTVITAANGTILKRTLTGNITFTDALTTGQSVTMELKNGASYTVTWPAMMWSGGAAPTLTANDTLVFHRIDGTTFGVYIGANS